MDSDHGVTFRMAVGSWRGAARFLGQARYFETVGHFSPFRVRGHSCTHVEPMYDFVPYYNYPTF